MIRKISLILLIGVIVFSFIALGISLAKEKPREVQTIPYTFKVKDRIGINLDTDKLHFGGGEPETILQRKLFINVSVPSRVVISSEGPGEVSADKNNFLTESQSEEVLMSLKVPTNLPEGLYEGIIFVYLYDS